VDQWFPASLYAPWQASGWSIRRWLPASSGFLDEPHELRTESGSGMLTSQVDVVGAPASESAAPRPGLVAAHPARPHRFAARGAVGCMAG
jgi:hypothetical protein